MDEEKEFSKKRRRSMRTLRRQSGVLPLNLLASDYASESAGVEGKINEEDQATFGSIWFESQEPVKERRKRRSNIFSSLPKNSSCGAGGDLTEKLEIRSDDVKVLENSIKALENSTVQDTDMQCQTPSIMDNENLSISYGSCNIQSSPERDLSNVSPSSMSPDFPMSPSVAMYMIHDKRNSVPNNDSINVPDISDQEETMYEANQAGNEPVDNSLSDKENSLVFNDSNVNATISPQTEKEYAADVSPGFFFAAKSFAGKVMNFVKTSPSYLANTLLNISDTSNVSASPVLKGNTSISSVNDGMMESDSPVIEGESLKHLVKLESVTELKNSVIENMDGKTLDNSNKSQLFSLIGSARKKRDQKSFYDTFAAITEELMKDTEVNKPIKSQESFKSVKHSVDCENDKESEQLCDKIQEDEVNEHKALVTPEHIPEILASDNSRENYEKTCGVFDEQIKSKLYLNVCKHKNYLNVGENISDQYETEKQVDNGNENMTDAKQNIEKNASSTPSIQEKMETPELTGSEYHDCSNNSDRDCFKSRKRRALDVAYISQAEGNTNEGKDENSKLDSNIEEEVEMPESKSFEETTMTDVLNVETGVQNMCSGNSDNSSPKLSLINILSNEQNISQNSLDDNSTEHDSCKKKGRRRAFGFFAADESKLNTASENVHSVKQVGEAGNTLNTSDKDSDKDVGKNASGSVGTEMTRMETADENVICDKIDNSVGTLIDNDGGGDLEIKKKLKSSRRTPGKFNFISQYRETLGTNEISNVQSHGVVVNECETVIDCEKLLTFPASQKSIELNSSSRGKLDSDNDSTTISSISNEVPKKHGRPKKCFNANSLQLAEVKESNEVETVNTEISIESPVHRINTFAKQTKSGSETAIEKNVGDTEISLNDVNIGNSVPKKRGRRKSADAAALNIKKLEHFENDTKDKEIKNNIVVPKKRGRRKSADAAALNINKLELFEINSKDKEMQNNIVVPKKRGRRKSADAAALNINKLEHFENNTKDNETRNNIVPKKRGRRKSADASCLQIKKCELNGTENSDNDYGNETNVQKKPEYRKCADVASLSDKKTVLVESENTDIELNRKSAIQKKRGRRKSADTATLKLQMINNDDNIRDASDTKRGKKRKLETLEDIEKLYRNKNYTKPDERKPWQTIVESPHNPAEVFKKQRLQRYIDFENPSQLKLRRRFQKAIKNGWDHKMKNIGELDDEFVHRKLASVWSELDEELQTEDLQSKLQSIVETV